MRYTYYVQNFECEACARAISKIVSRFPGASVAEVDNANGKITIECEENDEKLIVESVQERGFILSKNPGQTKSAFAAALKYAKGVFEGKNAFSVERAILENALISFFLVISLEVLAIFLFKIPVNGYKWFFVLNAVAIAANSFAIWHSIAYRKEFTCMNGMMVGMALGMISGFMVGAVVAATNGMFIGSVVGMALGMAIGAYTGYCCGIMGVLEGLMAGLMAGIMGAMTTVMLFNDHLIEFLFILFGACSLILAGLSYMIWKEAGGQTQQLPSTAKMIALNVIVAIVLAAIMVFGPKGPLTWVGVN